MSDEGIEALRPPPGEATADAIRAAFRGAREAGIRLDAATTTEGDTWTRVQFQQAATVAAAFREDQGDEFITAHLTTAVRENAEAMGAVVLDEDPECTWMPLRDDMTPDRHGMVREPKWFVLTVHQRVAVPEGHPALLLDEEAP